MILLGIFRSVLGPKAPDGPDGAPARPEPKIERVVLPLDRYKALSNEIAGVRAELEKARMRYCDDRQRISNQVVELYKKALSGYVADIPGSFRGTYHDVPGVFEVDVRVDAETNMFEPAWTYEVLIRSVQIVFRPLLMTGVCVRWFRDSVYISSDELCYIKPWPEGVPWPGTRFVNSLMGLTLTPEHDEKMP